MNTKIWIELETTKGGNLNTFTYRGQINKEHFDAWISGQLRAGIIKMEQVYWTTGSTNPDEPLYVGYGFANTTYFDFTGDLYLKVDDICSISPLHGREAHQLFAVNEQIYNQDKSSTQEKHSDKAKTNDH